MAMKVEEIQKWLSQFEGNEVIAIDDGGLTLVLVVDNYGLKIQPMLEVGGLPDEEED